MWVHCSLRERRPCRKAASDSPMAPARLQRSPALQGRNPASRLSGCKNHRSFPGIPAHGRHIGGITGGIQLVARRAARYFFKRRPHAAEDLAASQLGSRDMVAFIRAGTTRLSLGESVSFLPPAEGLKFATSGCEANGNEPRGSAKRAPLCAGT